jgi:histone-lysine N-methyltransferase ASH1L
LNLQSPRRSGSRPTRRQSEGSLRSSSRRAASPSSKAPPAGVRTRRSAGKVEDTKVPLELRRLQDTKEFAHSDEKPVIYTVWSNGKYVDPNEPLEPSARKKAKVAIDDEEPEKEKESSEPITNTKKRRVKKYLDKGLYAGQDAPADITKGLTVAEKKKLVEMPELLPSGRVNKTMPSPMFTGLRMLIAGRDFKLPYNVCNPLPPGQPKPDEWKKMTKSTRVPCCRDFLG